MNFAEAVWNFHVNARITLKIDQYPVDLVDPYEGHGRAYLRQFVDRFYGHSGPRVFVIGINPGRLGSGRTGVPFTDAYALETACCIPNPLPKSREITSSFIYDVIEQTGGAKGFFGHYYLGAAVPFAFIKEGRNANYYDLDIDAVARDAIIAQASMGGIRKAAIVLGMGKHFHFVKRLNDSYKLFEHIEAIAHPRYIMQYQRRSKNEAIAEYCAALERAKGFIG
jgi:hypothetical protein